MTNFENRLFGGRLFAGKLFRGRRPTPDTGGGSDAPRRRTDFELSDDELIEIVVALITSGALDG